MVGLCARPDPCGAEKELIECGQSAGGLLTYSIAVASCDSFALVGADLKVRTRVLVADAGLRLPGVGLSGLPWARPIFDQPVIAGTLEIPLFNGTLAGRVRPNRRMAQATWIVWRQCDCRGILMRANALLGTITCQLSNKLITIPPKIKRVVIILLNS